MTQFKVLFIGDDSAWSKLAVKHLIQNNFDVEAVFWNYGTNLTPVLTVVEQWKGDWILSFKSDLILPMSIINNAKLGAINFHPAPVRYRGIGGYQYATDNRDTSFGVTCHYIDNQIDHGRIIKSIEFDIVQGESAESLMIRTAIYALSLFHEITTMIKNGIPIPTENIKWTGKLYTRTQLSNYLIRMQGNKQSKGNYYVN